MSKKVRKESSGKLATQLVCEAEAYTRPFRRQLSVLDVGESKLETQEFLRAVDETQRLIQTSFGASVPDFFIENLRDAITNDDLPLARFTFRALERQIMAVLIECEIEHVDPTWSRRKPGRPNNSTRRTDFIRFMDLINDHDLEHPTWDIVKSVNWMAQTACGIKDQTRAKSELERGGEDYISDESERLSEARNAIDLIRKARQPGKGPKKKRALQKVS